MSGYEEQLHARAEMLEETSELAAVVTAILDGASGAGVDPRAIVSLRAAITELDPAGGAPPGYQAGSRTDRQPGSGYGSDAEFLEAVSDAEDQTLDWLRDAGQLQEQVIAALDVAHDDRDRAQRDLQTARQDLAAAYAMPTTTDCDAATAGRPPRSPPPRQPSPPRRNGSGTPNGASASARTPPRSWTRSPAAFRPLCRRSARCHTTSARSTNSSTGSSAAAGRCPAPEGGSPGRPRFPPETRAGASQPRLPHPPAPTPTPTPSGRHHHGR